MAAELQQTFISKNLLLNRGGVVENTITPAKRMDSANSFKPPIMGETRKKPIYVCKGCNIIFHTKRGLLNHNEETCILCHVSRKHKNELFDEWSDKTPSVKELYQLCKLLTNKVISLEAKVEELENGTVGKTSRMPVSSAVTLKWLNTSYIPTQGYIDWLSELKITRKNLETVYEYSLVEGIIEVLSQYPVLPIKLFPRKKKIYIFSQEGTREFPSWTDNMTEDDFRKFIDILCNRVMKEFIHWQRENEKKIIQEDAWKDKYILYTKKIMRTQAMTDKICSQIKKWLTNLGGVAAANAVAAV